MPQDRPVDSAALAAHFGVTVGTVNRWVREGRVPCIRPSRRIVRFHIRDVEQALQGRVCGTDDAGRQESAAAYDSLREASTQSREAEPIGPIADRELARILAAQRAAVRPGGGQ